MNLPNRLFAILLSFVVVGAEAQAESAFDCHGLENDTDLATLEGRDGVFFRINSDLRMDQPFSNATVADLARLSRVLASRGTTLVFAPVPTKSVVMAAWLPERARLMGFDADLAADVQRDILDRLEEAGVVTADLGAGLRKAASDRETFFRTDTHWNAYGAELAAMAVAKVLRAQPAYEALTKTEHETVEVAEKAAFSGMRRILQRRCKNTLPEPLTMTYRTRVVGTDLNVLGGAIDLGLDSDTPLDIGLGGDSPLDIGLAKEPLQDISLSDNGQLDIGLYDAALNKTGIVRYASNILPVALVGTSFSDLAVSNFPGFLAQHAGVEVFNFALTGGGQYGAITSYLTSDDFQAAPPAFLIWEVPVYTNLAQTGDQQIRELIAASSLRCSVPLAIEATVDRLGLKATLPPGLGPENTLFLDTDNPATASAAFRFGNDAGRMRTKSIRRGERLRLNGRFYMPLTGLWPEGANQVEIAVSISFGQSPKVFVCTPET